MTSSEESFDQMSGSEEEYRPIKPTTRSMNLRERNKRSYRELEYSDHEIDNDQNPNKIPKIDQQNSEDMPLEALNGAETNEAIKNDDSSTFLEETGGVFYPDIDVILWRREKEADGNKKFEYLVKYKEYSYLHVEWLDEQEIVNSKSGKNKLNRFTKTFEKKLLDQELDLDDDRYFDPTYIEIDRIIYCTELFPIIHPKKSNEIKGKWNETLVTIVSKLLNYSKDNVHYGIYFMEPVNPERDGIPNYKRIITNPMDFGTIMNRLYLDYYKTVNQFWFDLGLVFRNCRIYFKDPDCDIRILCDTLCEVAIELYRQWHAISKAKYDTLFQEYNEKQKMIEEIQKEEEFQEKELIKRQTEEELRRRGDELHNFIHQFEKFQTQDTQNHQNNISRISQDQAFKTQLAHFITNNPIIRSQTLNLEDILRNVNDPSVNFDTLLQQVNPNCRQHILDNLQNSPLKTVFPNQNFNPFLAQQLPNNNNENNPEKIIKKEEFQALSIQESMNPQKNSPHKAAHTEISQRVTKEKIKFENSTSLKEIEILNPGPLDFAWLSGGQTKVVFDVENYVFLGEQELREIDINKEVDKLYMVKWKNLSYLEATWEHESLLAAPNKINDFKIFNRSLDKEGRTQMLNKVQRHKTLLDLMLNPKKKSKLSYAYIQDLKNKLYHYDVLNHKQPYKYTLATQPIYKERKLLREYQLESLNWLIQAWYSKRNVILADEMGLGKTIQTIAFLNHLVNFENCRGPFLVIAPLSTLEHWKRTIEDWTNLNGVLYYDVNGIEGRQCCRGYEWFYTDISTKGSVLQSSDLYKFHIIVTSNEVFLQDLNNVVLNLPIQYIVVDEAHRLKNQNAKILTALKKLPCKRILLLTGTPIQNNTEELWSLLNYIEPERFQKLEEFKEKFGDLNNAEQIECLHKILKPFLLRRMKEDVESSIPPLQETIIDIELTTTQKAIYRALYEKNKTILSRGFGGGSFTTSLNNLEMQLRKCCNHPYLIHEIENECNRNIKTNEEKITKLIEASGKMILLDKLLPKMKGENKKVLIFSQFTYMLVLLEDYLKHKGYRFEKIDGTVKAKERQNAIDRFNNPDKKRDVFLLSTKAGGLGINLTSANVVIIFDSDWNPQNDVQATARAHRIGQMSEVQVYRLITARTYESEMLERATKKLGLDQAIFLGGAFQSTGIDLKKEDGSNKITSTETNDKKMSKQEIEMLLKKGILGLLEEGNQETKAFMEEDIDEILKKNSRIAKYSLINGTYTFSKSSFVSNQTDQNIKLDDPNFWELVLKNTETQAKKLLGEMESNIYQFEYIEAQKEFMLKISEIVNQLIESKLNVTGYNADEETNIQEILNRILSIKHFHKYFKELATQWLYEIARPTRRFKKLSMVDLDICGRGNERRNFKQLGTMGKGEVREDNSDYEQIFNENDGDVDNDGSQGEMVDEESLKKRLTGKEMEDRLKKLCYLCEKSKCTFFCEGFCKRSFHEVCKNRVEEGNEPIQVPDDVNELKLDADRVTKLMKTFTCHDCTINISTCFKCKKKGTYIPSEGKKDRRKAANPDEMFIESELTKCSTVNCYRFYHLSCISSNKLIRYVDSNQQKFRCPLHYCNKCSLTGDSMSLIQCFRCPTSYHSKCCPKEKILKLSKKFMICQNHNPIKNDSISNEEGIGIGASLKRRHAENRSSLVNSSTLIKLPKFQDNIDNYSNDDISQQAYKIKKKVEKFNAKETEKNSRNRNSTNNNSKPSLESQHTQKESGSSNTIKLKIPSKKKKDNNRIKNFGNRKPIPEPKYSYKDLGIQSPQEFNYETYTKDWCRYCGTRFSGSFTKGPWGPRTLCTVHYIEWVQKKSLNLSSYKEKPKKPLNLKENRELSFISNKLKQNPEYNPKTEIEEENVKKKVKLNDDNNSLEPGEIAQDQLSAQNFET